MVGTLQKYRGSRQMIIAGALAATAATAVSAVVIGVFGVVPWFSRATGLFDTLAVILLLSAGPAPKDDAVPRWACATLKLRWVFVAVCLFLLLGKAFVTLWLCRMDVQRPDPPAVPVAARPLQRCDN